MTKRTFRHHTQEFKQEAVRLALESGRPKAEIARELGVGTSLLYGWIQKFCNLESRTASAINTPEEAEIKRLRQELKKAQIENEILKKATAYFARDQL